jgi:hypothetical protein
MKDMIKNTIDMLREKVKENLTQIQNNQKEIRTLLKQENSLERTEKLDQRYAINKALLSENNDFINVQLTLTNFLEKYDETEILKEESKKRVSYRDENECFEFTVNGYIIFDPSHPYYADEKFFNRLLHYYEHLEDYEKCSQLVNIKSSSK